MNKPLLVERTAKRYKAGMLAGGAGVVCGVIAAIAGSPNVSYPLLAVGLAVYLVARFLAWWTHG